MYFTTWAALPVRNRKMGVENVVQDLETQDKYRLWEMWLFQAFSFFFFIYPNMTSGTSKESQRSLCFF